MIFSTSCNTMHEVEKIGTTTIPKVTKLIKNYDFRNLLFINKDKEVGYSYITFLNTYDLKIDYINLYEGEIRGEGENFTYKVEGEKIILTDKVNNIIVFKVINGETIKDEKGNNYILCNWEDIEQQSNILYREYTKTLKKVNSFDLLKPMNDINFDYEYLNKYIILTGKITEMIKKNDNTYDILFNSDSNSTWDNDGIYCNFFDINEIGKLKIGDTITLTGKINKRIYKSYDKRIFLIDCEIH